MAPSRIYDFIVVGQGLAGSVLSLALLRRGQRILVLDDPGTPAASEAAAGLVNPVTGRRLSRTWLADCLFPFLADYYPAQEQWLGQSFFKAMPIYRPFASVEEQNTWLAETGRPEIARFAQICPDNALPPGLVRAPHGALCIRHAGCLEVAGFLAAARRHFQALGILRAERLVAENITFENGGVRYGDCTAAKLVFCDGPHAVSNPFFGWLPFRPVKGEWLHVAIDEFQAEYIVNQHLFVIPLPDGTFRAGATYDWRNLDWQPTEAGCGELLDKLNRLILRPVQVLGQRAGLRPATADRRPLAGLHPARPELCIFGGLGSKGVSLAPYLAHHFVECLLSGKPPMPEINTNRYISFYKSV